MRPPGMGRNDPGLALRCAGTPMSVRRTLVALRAQLSVQGLPDACLSSVEIATAEALNNIVEHAHRGCTRQDIHITATLGRDRLCVCIRDHGQALPGERVPTGPRPDPSAPRNALPEGGFGWFLIRDLTEQVLYQRIGEENLLWLQFRLYETDGEGQKP